MARYDDHVSIAVLNFSILIFNILGTLANRINEVFQKKFYHNVSVK